jgi:hypothetical protein
MVTESFLGVKRPGCGVDHPPQFSVEVKERVELYLFPIWAFMKIFTFTFRKLFFTTANTTTNTTTTTIIAAAAGTAAAAAAATAAAAAETEY